jgi:hypothetical protein
MSEFRFTSVHEVLSDLGLLAQPKGKGLAYKPARLLGQ